MDLSGRDVIDGLHVQYVSVFTCMCLCLCLYILLWSICSGFIWIITFLWPFFSVSQKARSQSNKDSHPILILLQGTTKELLWKNIQMLSCLITNIDNVHYLVLNEEKKLLFNWIVNGFSTFRLCFKPKRLHAEFK